MGAANVAGADDLAALLVIEVVVVGAVREDDLGPDGVQEANHLLQDGLVEHDAQVALLEAVVSPADGLGGGGPLSRRIRRSRPLVLGRPAIPGCHRRDVDRPAAFPAETRGSVPAQRNSASSGCEDGNRDGVHGGFEKGAGPPSRGGP